MVFPQGAGGLVLEEKGIVGLFPREVGMFAESQDEGEDVGILGRGRGEVAERGSQSDRGPERCVCFASGRPHLRDDENWCSRIFSYPENSTIRLINTALLASVTAGTSPLFCVDHDVPSF